MPGGYFDFHQLYCHQKMYLLEECVHHVNRILSSRVLLVEYFTSQAVKQDIVRSLASRLELHWDSLIEEEHGSPEGILI
jgi:hypothetical protein